MKACAHCGELFEFNPHQGGVKRAYCSVACKRAAANAKRCLRRAAEAKKRREEEGWDWDFGNLLHELAPEGLTDDCPARSAA